MASVGIDIGTSSVRVAVASDYGSQVSTLPISVHSSETAPFITQSSRELYTKIISLLDELDTREVGAISATATCSMVVREIVWDEGKPYLIPHLVNNIDENNQDIILWMDNRARKQCDYLNDNIESDIKRKVGGSFIPEMGLPKLKWLSDTVGDKNLVCFELYDWFSYLFLCGGFDKHSNRVPFIEHPQVEMLDFPSVSEAMDGSIKGWSKKFLNDLGIAENIRIGRSEFNLPNVDGLLPAGVPLGYSHEELDLPNDVLICNGCIDCYAGWLSTIDIKSLERNTLSMIAGTSTCFVLSTSSFDQKSIPGIWGPFDQLLCQLVSLFEFGQPATGKLFETLFNNYATVIKASPASSDDIFDFLEKETQKLEHKYCKPILVIAKNYFWYVDQFGNRSPYNDLNMSEILIDGYNASDSGLESITNGSSLMGLVIRFNLILEFLCFQTRQILEIIESHQGPVVDSILISGSQGKNLRFINLLSLVTNKPVKCLLLVVNSDCQVVFGACILSKIGLHLLNVSKYSEALRLCIPLQISLTSVACQSAPTDLALFLDIRYQIFLDMCLQQRRYRELVAPF